MPEGAGAVNDKGLGYYSRLVDALLARGIEPYATLFHWDLPQALFEKGGWASRDTAKRLADYSAVVAERLGDKLKNFIVLNEAAVHTVAGHLLGLQAPGLKAAKLLGPVTHHQNLGQGLAIQALRAARSLPSADFGPVDFPRARSAGRSVCGMICRRMPSTACGMAPISIRCSRAAILG